MDYDAFLSYSYAIDRPLAAAVQRGLHSLARPWYRPRALRVFRDQTSLSASPGLWPAIEAALRSSRHFILMASPEAAASAWVRREVAHWRAERRAETFLIVLTSGEIVWDDVAGDFDWERTTALPPELRGWFDVEPQWANLGWARAEAQLSLRNARFRDEVGTVAAAVHGLPKDEFDGEDVRRHRTAVRLRRAAVSGLALLAVVATGLGVVAVRAQDTAERQRDQAVARELVVRSEQLGDRDPALSRLLAAAAWRVAESPETRAGLLAAAGRPGRDVLDASADTIAISPDGRTMAVVNESVQLWDLAARQPVGEPFSTEAAVFAVFSPDGATLAVSTDDGQVRLWDTATRRQIGIEISGRDGEGQFDVIQFAPPVAFSPDGTRLAVADDRSVIRIWDLAARQVVGKPFIGHLPDRVHSNAPVMGFVRDGRALATVSAVDGAFGLWDVATGRPHRAPARTHGPNEIAPTPAAIAVSGDLVATASQTAG